VDGWGELVAVMAVLGAANATCQGTSNRTVATVLPAHRRGLGFGLKQSAVPMAIMLGGLAVPTTTEIFGWRSTFLVTGTVGLLVALVGVGGLVRGTGQARRQRQLGAQAGLPAHGAATAAPHTRTPPDHP